MVPVPSAMALSDCVDPGVIVLNSRLIVWLTVTPELEPELELELELEPELELGS